MSRRTQDHDTELVEHATPTGFTGPLDADLTSGKLVLTTSFRDATRSRQSAYITVGGPKRGRGRPRLDESDRLVAVHTRIPQPAATEVARLADERETSIGVVLRELIELGLEAYKSR